MSWMMQVRNPKINMPHVITLGFTVIWLGLLIGPGATGAWAQTELAQVDPPDLMKYVDNQRTAMGRDREWAVMFIHRWFEANTTWRELERDELFDFLAWLDQLEGQNARFSVRWSGFIEPKQSGKITFGVTVDDRVRIWIDERLIIDAWEDGSTGQEASGVAALQAGKRHALRIEYQNASGPAGIRLEWQGPGQTREVVPAAQLTAPGADRRHALVGEYFLGHQFSRDGLKRHDPGIDFHWDRGYPTDVSPFLKVIHAAVFEHLWRRHLLAGLSQGQGDVAALRTWVERGEAGGHISPQLRKEAQDLLSQMGQDAEIVAPWSLAELQSFVIAGRQQAIAMDVAWAAQAVSIWARHSRVWMEDEPAQQLAAVAWLHAIDPEQTAAAQAHILEHLWRTRLADAANPSELQPALLAEWVQAAQRAGYLQAHKQPVIDLVRAVGERGSGIASWSAGDLHHFLDAAVRLSFDGASVWAANVAVQWLEANDLRRRQDIPQVLALLNFLQALRDPGPQAQALARAQVKALEALWWSRAFESLETGQLDLPTLRAWVQLAASHDLLTPRFKDDVLETLARRTEQASQHFEEWSFANVRDYLAVGQFLGSDRGRAWAAELAAKWVARNRAWPLFEAGQLFELLAWLENLEGRGQTFSAQWTGYIYPEQSDEYAFHLAADDRARLWIGERLIVDQWDQRASRTGSGTLQLQGGERYPIRVVYQNTAGPGLIRLEWEGQWLDRQAVPADRLSPPDDHDPGLRVHYYQGAQLDRDPLSRIVANIDFAWPQGYPTEAHPGLDAAQAMVYEQMWRGQALHRRLRSQELAPDAQRLQEWIEVGRQGGYLTPALQQRVLERLVRSMSDHPTWLMDGSVQTLDGYLQVVSALNVEGSRGQIQQLAAQWVQMANAWRGMDRPDQLALLQSLVNLEGGPAFSARWTGFLFPRFSETYTFRFQADDGVRVWIDNQPVADTWHGPAHGEVQATVDLSADQTAPVWIEYRNLQGQGRLHVTWESESQPRQTLGTADTAPSGGERGDGLRGEYFLGDQLNYDPVVRVEEGLDFTWRRGYPLDLATSLDAAQTMVFQHVWKTHLADPQRRKQVGFAEMLEWVVLGRACAALDEQARKALMAGISEQMLHDPAVVETMTLADVVAVQQNFDALGAAPAHLSRLIVQWLSRNGLLAEAEPARHEDELIERGHQPFVHLAQALTAEDAAALREAIVDAQGRFHIDAARTLSYFHARRGDFKAWQRHLYDQARDRSLPPDQQAAWWLAFAHAQEIQGQDVDIHQGRSWIGKAFGAAESDGMRMIALQWLVGRYLAVDQHTRAISIVERSRGKFASESRREEVVALIHYIQAAAVEGVR